MDEKPQNQIALVAGSVEIYLPLSGLIDPKAENKRLSSELKELTGQIKRLEDLLASPFAKKAPEAVVNKEKEKLAGYKDTVLTLNEQIKNLKGV